MGSPRHAASAPPRRRAALIIASASFVLIAAVAVSFAALGLFSPASTISQREEGPPPGIESVTATVGPTTTPDATATPAVPSPPAAVEPIALSVLSDSHAYFAQSWWRQTVEAGAVGGVRMAAFASQPGADSRTIASGLDEAATAAAGGYVLVQAGTNDLLEGSSPADAAAGIEALWAGVLQRGSTPIAVLVPPSSEVGSEVIELNRLLSTAAAQQQISILDVYSCVARSDGTWADGASDDGKHANLTGSTTQAAEVLRQLPALLTTKRG